MERHLLKPSHYNLHMSSINNFFTKSCQDSIILKYSPKVLIEVSEFWVSLEFQLKVYIHCKFYLQLTWILIPNLDMTNIRSEFLYWCFSAFQRFMICYAKVLVYNCANTRGYKNSVRIYREKNFCFTWLISVWW